jgi:GH25 family lysozyme M1 (1,4-beta-N-acetylmuramidase)/aspartate carbamoyltransferase regulatory subunit
MTKIEVTLQEDLTCEFLEEKKVSDYIVSLNGEIVDDYTIDTTSIGEKEVTFNFINDDGFNISYKYNINIVDNTSPVIWMGNSYTITQGNDVDIVSNILCGDNEDANPNCYIEGEYDYNTVGTYPLVFKAIDRSGNETTKQFNLNVVAPTKNSSKKETTSTLFSDVVKNYKTDNTKIGIDVSGWQGNIDFETIKNAGVEFIIIKVGGTKGTNGDYYVDSKFIQNITQANELGIDVGIYFYSYASTNTEAKNDALWVLDQIKDYEVTLPITFDWEDWSSFNDYNLSFFGLTNLSNTFLDTVSEKGYKGMLYSSKSYLEKIWLPTKYDTWLAHYTDKTNYSGNYKYWQICDDGIIDGIDGAVDIDIMYLD